MSWWLKAVPWSVIIANAPALVESARKLLDKRRPAGPTVPAGEAASPEARLAELESRQLQMAGLIEALAQSNQQLTEALAVLRARARLNFRIAVVLAIGVLGLAIRTFAG